MVESKILYFIILPREVLVFSKLPYLLDQKPRLLIFSCRSRGGHYSRVATILFINTKLSTYTSIYILFCIFHNPQFKSNIKISFLLGGSHILPKRYKTWVLLR